MDVTRLLSAGFIAAALAGASLAPAAAQSRSGDATQPPSAQPPSDLEMRFKEGVQELGEGAQKIASALEDSARDFWAASKAAVEAGAQTWQARRDARQPEPTSPQR